MIEILQGLAGLGALTWYVSSLYVGGRLLRLGIRNENPPARWIGTYLFFAMGLGSLLYTIAMARTVLAGAPMTTLDRGLIAVHFLVAIIANYGLLTFTHRVFRRESTLSGCAAAVLLLMIIVGAVGHGLTTNFDGDFATVYGAVYLAGPVLANAWASVESVLYYRLMRKRLEVGLAEPLVANRFLLWGIGAGSAAFLLGFNWVEMQLMPRVNPGATEGVQVVALAGMAVLGLVCAGSYLFAFFPARWYVRRVASAPSEG